MVQAIVQKYINGYLVLASATFTHSLFLLCFYSFIHETLMIFKKFFNIASDYNYDFISIKIKEYMLFVRNTNSTTYGIRIVLVLLNNYS